MRNVFVILCAAAGLTLAGYASGGSEAEASEKPHIQAVFKKGSKVCTWTDSEGNKGTDYFYKDKSALSGSADRVIGKDLKQGTWQITGAAMNLNWYGGKKGKGRWYKVAGTGKKSFQLTTTDGAERYSMKCK